MSNKEEKSFLVISENESIDTQKSSTPNKDEQDLEKYGSRYFIYQEKDQVSYTTEIKPSSDIKAKHPGLEIKSNENYLSQSFNSENIIMDDRTTPLSNLNENNDNVNNKYLHTIKTQIINKAKSIHKTLINYADKPQIIYFRMKYLALIILLIGIYVTCEGLYFLNKGKCMTIAYCQKYQERREYGICKSYLDYRNSDSAVMCFEELIKKPSFRPIAIYDLAIIKSDNKEYARSAELLKEYMKYDSTDINVFFTYTNVLVKLEEIEHAIINLYNILRINENHIKSLELLYSIHEQRQEDNKLIKIAERLLKLKGASEVLLMKLSNSYIKLREFDKAEFYLKKLIDFKGPNVFSLNNLAFIQNQFGNIEASIEFIDKALELEPYNETLLLNRAVASYYDDDISAFFYWTERAFHEIPHKGKSVLLHGYSHFLIGNYGYAWELYNIGLNMSNQTYMLKLQSNELIDHTFAFRSAQGYYCTADMLCVYLPCWITSFISFIFVDTYAIENCKADRNSRLRRLNSFIPSVLEFEVFEMV